MLRATALAAATALLATAALAQADDLTGIWQITTPIVQLKTSDGHTPPLTPAALKLYRERIARHAKGDLSYDPTQVCKPIGEPRVMYEGQPFQIVQTPKVVIFQYQWNRLDHLLYPDTKGPLGVPTYFGTGPMQWDGHTLAVQLSMLHEGTLLDAAGLPHSDELQLTEKYHLDAGGKTLIETIRFEDPKTFTRPWSTTLRYRRLNVVRLEEDVCEERMKLFAHGLPIPAASARPASGEN